MYRRVLIGGVTAAAVLGAGGTAMALTTSGTTSGSPSGSSSSSSSAPAHAKAKGRAGALLRHLSHGQIVTHGKNGYVVHDLINGTVTAVSSSSITVQAGDKASETFAINKDTKVRMRTNGHGAASSISAVHTGDHVVVAGTGAHTYTAKHVVDVKK